MGTLFTVVVLAFVVVVGAAVGFAVFEMSPFGRHSDHYRDEVTGKRRWHSPNLEDGHF